jgi:predicted AAA+ superfamily ATPase
LLLSQQDYNPVLPENIGAYSRGTVTSQSQTIFLFGTRGTGKSTLLRERFGEHVLYIDLLNINTERTFARDTESLEAKIRAYQEQNTSAALYQTTDLYKQK